MLNLPAAGNRILLEAILFLHPSTHLSLHPSTSIHPSIHTQQATFCLYAPIHLTTLVASVYLSYSVFINYTHTTFLSIYLSIPPSCKPASQSTSQPAIHLSIHPFQNQTEKIGFPPESNCLSLPFPQSAIHSHVPVSLPDCENRIFPGSNSNYYITPPPRCPLLPSYK